MEDVAEDWETADIEDLTSKIAEKDVKGKGQPSKKEDEEEIPEKKVVTKK